MRDIKRKLYSNFKTTEFKSTFNLTSFYMFLLFFSFITFNFGAEKWIAAKNSLPSEDELQTLESSDTEIINPATPTKEVDETPNTDGAEPEATLTDGAEPETQYTVRVTVDSSLSSFTIQYKIGNEKLQPLPQKDITRNSPFEISFYATNAKLKDCNEVPLGKAHKISDSSKPTPISLSSKDIPQGKCPSLQYKVTIVPEHDLAGYILKYQIDDGELIALDENLSITTVDQPEPFAISFYISNPSLNDCIDVLLGEPHNITDSSKTTTISVSIKEVPQGKCTYGDRPTDSESGNMNLETETLMNRIAKLTNSKYSTIQAKDNTPVEISDQNVQINADGDVTVKSKGLSVGTINVDEGTVTVEGSFFGFVKIEKGKVVLRCDAATKTMPFGFIQKKSSSKLLSYKELKAEGIDVEIEMNGDPKEDFLLGVGTVSGFNANINSDYKYRTVKSGEIVTVGGFGNVQYDAFANNAMGGSYPFRDMTVLEVTKKGNSKTPIIIGVVVAVVVVIIIVVVVVILVLKKKNKDRSTSSR
ncbi:hypothetical protein TRFO_41639 [Tritrichomonas foetus]|uniref:Uncharacterized protein n=1 Tax=Tritrichomonas foetus TaxID=1144522 RepID=A0A1J4KZK4_9EUKA|nr:hypothetical protein TRFO_41639 [Tritrichomonas foetus]|eukprot:OHT16689.1 hypothetical protein TRFO_41639 [Tritrichomonas foetus]